VPHSATDPLIWRRLLFGGSYLRRNVIGLAIVRLSCNFTLSTLCLAPLGHATQDGTLDEKSLQCSKHSPSQYTPRRSAGTSLMGGPLSHVVRPEQIMYAAPVSNHTTFFFLRRAYLSIFSACDLISLRRRELFFHGIVPFTSTTYESLSLRWKVYSVNLSALENALIGARFGKTKIG